MVFWFAIERFYLSLFIFLIYYWTMMFLCIFLLCLLWRFQRVQDYRKRSSWAKVIQFNDLLFFGDRKYRPHGRYYRWPLPYLLPKTTSACEKSLLFSSGSGTGSNPGSTGVTGTTGPPGGTTAGNFRGYFRRPVPLMKSCLCFRAEWHQK